MADATAGVAVIGHEALTTIGAHGLAGDFSFALAGVMFATFGMLLRMWRIDPMRATAIVSTLTLLYVPVHAVAFGFDRMIAAGWFENAVQAVVQGVFSGPLAIYLFARSVAVPPWGLTLPGSIQLSLHTVLRGHVWLWLDERAEAVRLLPGDLALVVGGRDHHIAHEPEPIAGSGQRRGYPELHGQRGRRCWIASFLREACMRPVQIRPRAQQSCAVVAPSGDFLTEPVAITNMEALRFLELS